MFDRKNIIYCIGDSHVHFFSGRGRVQPSWPQPCRYDLPFFESYRLGPALAYNLYELNTKTRGRERLFEVLRKQIPKRSHVLLCFGEIDCRAHLLKEAERQNKPIAEIVEDCVRRYFSVVLEIRSMGYFPAIWNVVPATNRTDLDPETQEYPTYGSQIQRNKATELFNDKIEILCKNKKLPFVSIYDKLVDRDGNAISRYFSDRIHLSQDAMMFTLDVMKKCFPEINFNRITYTNNKYFRSMKYYKRLLIYKIFCFLNRVKNELSKRLMVS